MSEKETGIQQPIAPCYPISNPPGYASLYPTLIPPQVTQPMTGPNVSSIPEAVFGQPQSIINEKIKSSDGSPQVINYEVTYFAPTYTTVTHREFINCCEDCCEDCCENMCLNCCLDCSTIKNLPSLIFGNQKNGNNKANNAKNGNYALLENAIPLDASSSK